MHRLWSKAAILQGRLLLMHCYDLLVLVLALALQKTQAQVRAQRLS